MTAEFGDVSGAGMGPGVKSVIRVVIVSFFSGVGDGMTAYGWQGAMAGAVWGIVVVTSL